VIAGRLVWIEMLLRSGGDLHRGAVPTGGWPRIDVRATFLQHSGFTAARLGVMYCA